MFRYILNLIFTEGCYGCAIELTSQERFVCFKCLSQIQETGFHTHASDNELFYRLAGKVPLQGAAALFYFDKKGRLQELIRALKYQQAAKLGVFLGEYLGETIKGSAFLDDINEIVPVPLHTARLRKRGYNQAERIASGLSSVTNMPVNNQLLQRVRKTPSQTRKSRAARWSNVANAFELMAPPPRGILLLDDVITTGATLEACIHTLIHAEAPPEIVKIAGIGIARTG